MNFADNAAKVDLKERAHVKVAALVMAIRIAQIALAIVMKGERYPSTARAVAKTHIEFANKENMDQ